MNPRPDTSMKLWHTNDGRVLMFAEMESDHLASVITYLDKRISRIGKTDSLDPSQRWPVDPRSDYEAMKTGKELDRALIKRLHKSRDAAQDELKYRESGGVKL